MTVSYSAAARQSKASTDITSFGNNASITVYSGTRPASADTALSGNTALWTTAMGTGTPIGTASGGVITAGSIPSATISANGTATWARIYNSGGTAVADADVSANQTASFTASISGTTMTVTGTPTGTLAVGQTVSGAGVAPGQVIVAEGTGTGGAGTYTLTYNQTVASESMTSAFTGDIQFATTTFVAGVVASITSLTITEQ